MIKIEERVPQKIPGLSTLFISFDYNADVVQTLKNHSTVKNYDPKTHEWEVPISDLSELLDRLCRIDENIELHLLNDEKEEEKEQKILSEFVTKPFYYQEDAIKYGLNHDSWLLLDEPGLGKALDLNTKIYTPDGFKLMRDICVGDFVFGVDGKPTKVIAVYDHKIVNMYRVTFSDGSTVNCCEDHLWEIQEKNRKNRVVSTKWFLQNDQFGNKRCNHLYKYSIPRCSPIEFIEKDVPIDPYVLGAMLGDGSISTSNSAFSSADAEIIEKVNSGLEKIGCKLVCSGDNKIDFGIRNIEKNYCKYNYTYFANGEKIGTKKDVSKWLNYSGKTKKEDSKCSFLLPGYLKKHENKAYGLTWSREKTINEYSGNNFQRILKSLNLYGTNSHTKFIPEIYKYNSVSVRKEILRGLLDTDGYACADNTLQYYSVSKKLSDDVVWIVQSLGGVCSVHRKNSKLYGVDHGVCYVITIRIDDPSELVSLKRKKNNLHARKFKPKRKFEKIEKIENSPARCITVEDKRSLYVIENFIVTHNTLSTICLAQELKERGEIEHCLVICGVNTLKNNWKKEISKHSNLSCRILGERKRKNGNSYVGSVKDRVDDLKSPIDEFFVITNVETLRSDDIIKQLTKGKANRFEMIICDEIHTLKNPTSQQGKNFLKLNFAKYKIGMTGTLLTNSPTDAHVPLKWIGKDKATYTNFKYYYCEFGGQFGSDLIGYRNMKYLKDQIESCSLRRTKDVLNLPPKTIIHEFVDMEDDQRKFYDDIVNCVLDDIDKVYIETTQKQNGDLQASNLLAMMTRLRQATACPSMLSTKQVSNAKVDRACDLAEQMIENGNKVIIFSTFKPTLDILNEKLKQYNPVLCTGDISDAEISKSVDKFQESEYNKVMLATWQKMGVGLTLTAANYAIFIDCPYTAGGCEQVEDRVHRVGSSKPVFIYYLWCSDTVDERVKEIVEDKSLISDYVIDGKCSPGLVKRLGEIIVDLKRSF